MPTNFKEKNEFKDFIKTLAKDPSKELNFNEAIKNQVFTKIGMKQNSLSNYFQKKKVVYERVLKINQIKTFFKVLLIGQLSILRSRLVLQR
jgi:hypothetical protein